MDVVLNVLAVLSALGSFLILLFLVLTQRNAPRFYESIRNIQQVNEKPRVSVIITARNEEDKLPKCLNSLARQDYPNLEIIVVDDSSTDGTRALAEASSKSDSRIKVVDAGEREKEWIAKSWPCWKGYQSAGGNLLLFVDADSEFFNTSTISEAVNYLLAKEYDMLSISPRVRLFGIWASSTLPLVSSAIDLLYPMMKVNDPRSDRAYVFGTFILVKRAVYETIDGHRRVRASLVEDAAIAQEAKAKGYKLRIEVGTEFFVTDWEHERSKIYSGLERIMSASIQGYGLVSNVNIIFLFFLAVYPIFFVIGFALNPKSELLIGAIASVLNIIFFLSIFGIESRLVSKSVGPKVLLYPLGTLIFMSAIFTTSLKVRNGERIDWKGRSYQQIANNNKQAKN